MTESEAIKELHAIRPRGGIIPQKRAEALDVAINALEEVQQYRAIGTIEECRAAMERQNPIATIAEKEDTGTIASEIDAQPTAYDVDKVVEQLEKRIQTHERCIEYEKKNGTITEEFQQRKAVEVLNEAIEIVKGGGVDAKTDS